MFLETTPDTSGYMLAGYILTFTVLGIYLLSIFRRTVNLKRDTKMLESLKTEAKAKKK